MGTQVVDLLREYGDLFPKRFYKIKGRAGLLEEMKIQLKPYEKIARIRSYQLNHEHKERVKK